MSDAAAIVVPTPHVISGADERRVIIASSVGTVFEWYDFYLYAILAVFFAGLFFPPGNLTAATIGAFGAYAAGFLVRPFGAIIFGRIGDLVGRKYTFLVTIYIRLKLQESPIFAKLKTQGKRSKQPLRDSFFTYPNNKFVLLALLGATAGQGVVWYTGQFYALFFIQGYLKLDFIQTYLLIGISLIVGTPFFLVFGALSDRIGRKWIILGGCLIAAVTYFPLFRGLTHYINPALETYQKNTTVTVAADDCKF